MLTWLIIGSALLVTNLMLQLLVIIIVLRYLIRRLDRSNETPSAITGFVTLSVVTLTLFAGYLMQAGVWAALFLFVGEQFDSYQVAYYHSLVNFTSLGYGDIVMDPNWRLLGALEAANGVLMFGVGASALLATMNNMFKQRGAVARVREKLQTTED